jgi:hypothetical protein
MAVQILGTNMTFYMVEKQSPVLYTMTELHTLPFPLPINELPTLFGYLDRSYDVLYLFHEHCKKDNIDTSRANEAPSSPLLRAITKVTIDRKRKRDGDDEGDGEHVDGIFAI